MPKQLGSRRGLKRHKTPEKTSKRMYAKKSRRVEEKVLRSLSPETPEVSSGEESSDVASQEVIFREPSIYDNFLNSLASSNKALADVYKRRKRQGEGKSDTEEEDEEEEDIEGEDEEGREDDGSHHLSASDGEDNDFQSGADRKPRASFGTKSLMQEPISFSKVDSSGDVEEEDDSGASDSEIDEEHHLSIFGQSARDSSLSKSLFSEHLGHKLSSAEVDSLSNGKWKFKWELPAVDMHKCKWKGTGERFMDDIDIDCNYGLKPKLYKHWLEVFKKSGEKDFDSSSRRQFFSLFNSYRDVLHCKKKPFYHRGLEEDLNTMDAYLMHSLNHIFSTRDLVKKNDVKITKHQDTSNEEIISSDGFLDQGFTRPKVLILLPMRSIAFRVVKRLIQLTPEAQRVSVEHLDRFHDEFGAGEGSDTERDKSSKPADYQALFGGNSGDEFMIGVKFTRKSIRLYGDFYSSDMIIASPLKLHMAIGQAEEDKERDVDYLSSVEVLIIDHADIISMQNWSFLTSVVDQLNHIPLKQHGTNVMRIRQWYLDGYARFYRQSIILSYYLTPEMNALFNHHCMNYKGKVKLACEYKGVLHKVVLQVQQIYERFDADSIVGADDARLEYFTKKIFPKIKDSVQGGIMIFIHSYFEFVRLRNFLKSQSASFCLLGDYTKSPSISRGRGWFFEGKRKIMLYTERAYFYRRYKIRGIKKLIIYSLPEREEFYREMVNMVEDSHGTTCTVLFSRFDHLRLERIVGSSSAKKMIGSERSIFTFG